MNPVPVVAATTRHGLPVTGGDQSVTLSSAAYGCGGGESNQ